MRRAVKRQLEEILNTILEAHAEIKKNIISGAYGNVRNILADCQDCAVIIGNTIEETEKNQEAVIAKLEQYCEKLFFVHQELETIELSRVEEVKTELDAQIQEIWSDVKNNIPVKLKVVFMPYKASMWTSLESIWKAAEADPDCEAKVVVIPYAILTSQQQLDHIEYEANKFPEYVSITHYNNYDIAKECPDMIFIHNPYDGGNNVTRVPEKYYSYNLKKYTEQLIYSPYGLMGYYNPEKGAFMCLTNAVVFSDKVLVQSEKVKQIYMNHGVSIEKLLAIGSPKVDAIVEGMQKPIVYPDGWEEKLKGRKVFLINTHLSYFVKGYLWKQKAEKNIDYTKWYHNYFFDSILNRDDCALIWRPHPLMKDMLKSRNMTGSLEFVEQLENRIAKSNNAVLDTNGEYDISFNISDALITTYSSIIPEYMILGKPIFIFQNRYDKNNTIKSPVSYKNNYYISMGKGEPTFPKFLEMVLAGKDELYEERMKDVRDAFRNLDGTIGEKIYQYFRE